jgi:alkanesulfonate monooxygenase SsuD/methylene tetrahydromethanopterin reductase-like flavin-dependent oxidoreductase (luciferase family)
VEALTLLAARSIWVCPSSNVVCGAAHADPAVPNAAMAASTNNFLFITITRFLFLY